MKDNFNLKKYLIENKMTEASRGKARKHFVSLNESKWTDEKDKLYREFVGYETKYGRDKAVKIFQKFHPDVEISKIIPGYARRNQAMNDKADQARQTRIHKRDQFSEDPRWEGDRGYLARENQENDSLEDDWIEDDDRHAEDYEYVDRYEDDLIDEVGYTDDDDDEFYDDSDYLGARGSDADLGIDVDKRAERAARRGMKGTDLDVDTSDDEPDFSDSEEEVDDEFEDPEDISADSQPEATKGTVDMVKMFGKNAPYVEVLVDDLDNYLKGPRGNWRVNVSTIILRRAVDAARQYLEDYEYPRKGVLYLSPNKMGQYDSEVRDNGRAVVAVHRDPVDGSAKQ